MCTVFPYVRYDYVRSILLTVFLYRELDPNPAHSGRELSYILITAFVVSSGIYILLLDVTLYAHQQTALPDNKQKRKCN